MGLDIYDMGLNDDLVEQIMRAIRIFAGAYNLDPAIVYGVCLKESNFEPAAVRFEKNYSYLFDPGRVRPRDCSMDTEVSLQKTSWGLMQVMGGVLRERGFKGWITNIVDDIEAQVEFGCRHLSRFIARYGLEEGVAAYNAGSPRRVGATGKLVNQDYVDKVLEFAEAYRSIVAPKVAEMEVPKEPKA